ncbi:MAG: transposase [Arsenophonus sp. NEOnobi-MAG3]
MHTYDQQLNQHPHVHISVTHGDLWILKMLYEGVLFKEERSKKFGNMLSSSS